LTEYYNWQVDRVPLPEGDYGVVCYFRDVADEVKARAEIREHEERLRKMERIAAAGKIAASLAHEINNPLSSVTNVLYLLETNPNLDAEAHQFVATAAAELKRVARIVQQSLSYHRTGAQSRHFDVADVVSDSLQIFTDKFRRSGIELKPKVKSGSRIFGVPDEVRQILDNLLLNAAEAMPNGGSIAISVRPALSHISPSQSGVRLTVSDSGPGIPKEVFGRVFEPFFTTKAEKGTGLGLWVAQGIVAKHGGHVHLRTCHGGLRTGTTFSVFLPAKAAHDLRLESAEQGTAA
jgi:signal transduction histidine kinase